MSSSISESDWRRFKEVHRVLLERFCARTLDEIGAAIRAEGTAHEKYLQIYKLLQKRDEEIARAFDDFRRSTATMQLYIMRRMGLLTDEELKMFSEDTQKTIRSLESF